MPEDIHSVVWAKVVNIVLAGKFAATKEIYDELALLPGAIGACLKNQCDEVCLEVGEDDWPWKEYLENVEAMKEKHKAVISEYNGDRKGTVGLNDISIIALAKTLGLPVVSMESKSYQGSATKMRIPAVCEAEGVPHLTFNELLRAEGIKG
jgi:hypothetical protein